MNSPDDSMCAVSDLEALRSELARIRHRVRLLTIIVVSSAVTVVVAFGWDRFQSDGSASVEVRAQRFVLIDGQGRRQGVLQHELDGDKSSVELVLGDQDGTFAGLFVRDKLASIEAKNATSYAGVSVWGPTAKGEVSSSERSEFVVTSTRQGPIRLLTDSHHQIGPRVEIHPNNLMLWPIHVWPPTDSD